MPWIFILMMGIRTTKVLFIRHRNYFITAMETWFPYESATGCRKNSVAFNFSPLSRLQKSDRKIPNSTKPTSDEMRILRLRDEFSRKSGTGYPTYSIQVVKMPNVPKLFTDKTGANSGSCFILLIRFPDSWLNRAQCNVKNHCLW